MRWWLGTQLNSLFPTLLPGTLTANFLGGFIIGLALAFFAIYPAIAPEWRLLIVTGFCGGLTTFSTFSAEVVTLLQQGQGPWAIGADRFSKRAVLVVGFALFGQMCLGFSADGAGTWALRPDHQHGTGFGPMSGVDGVGEFRSSVLMGLLWVTIAPATSIALAGALALIGAQPSVLLGRNPEKLREEEKWIGGTQDVICPVLHGMSSQLLTPVDRSHEPQGRRQDTPFPSNDLAAPPIGGQRVCGLHQACNTNGRHGIE